MLRLLAYLGQDSPGNPLLLSWAGRHHDNAQGEIWIVLPITPEQVQERSHADWNMRELQLTAPW